MFHNYSQSFSVSLSLSKCSYFCLGFDQISDVNHFYEFHVDHIFRKKVFAVLSSNLNKTYKWQANVCNVKLYSILEFYTCQEVLGGRSWRLFLFGFLSHLDLFG